MATLVSFQEVSWSCKTVCLEFNFFNGFLEFESFVSECNLFTSHDCSLFDYLFDYSVPFLFIDVWIIKFVTSYLRWWWCHLEIMLKLQILFMITFVNILSSIKLLWLSWLFNSKFNVLNHLMKESIKIACFLILHSGLY